MSKCYGFNVETSGCARGYVTADSEEEAIRKIKTWDYDDINDEEITEFGDVVELWEIE